VTRDQVAARRDEHLQLDLRAVSVIRPEP